MAPTKLDLYVSAHAFALKTLDVLVEFDLAQESAKAFTAAKFEKADFVYWTEVFRKSRHTMTELRKQNPPSYVKPGPKPASPTTATPPRK